MDLGERGRAQRNSMASGLGRIGRGGSLLVSSMSRHIPGMGSPLSLMSCPLRSTKMWGSWYEAGEAGDLTEGLPDDMDDAQHIAQRRLKQPTFTRGLECIEVRVCV